ncbi:hypothetical protein AO063_23130 [Pseudomonas fluorescens ICMP 11288]|uniref:Uncharacterized protein n=1 Tax=Pseudomonas fluorescens ICMP 11288 TaxID=1198309 RepID=A0A0W0HVF5_PSEFL|nr:hypothetical protein AO063_23130 [Pseudomonas fluorescens ICMP 11288]
MNTLLQFFDQLSAKPSLTAFTRFLLFARTQDSHQSGVRTPVPEGRRGKLKRNLSAEKAQGEPGIDKV